MRRRETSPARADRGDVGEGDVVLDRRAEDHALAAALFGHEGDSCRQDPADTRRCGTTGSAHGDRPGLGALRAGQDAQQLAAPGAGEASDAEHLAPVRGERDVLDAAAVEPLDDEGDLVEVAFPRSGKSEPALRPTMVEMTSSIVESATSFVVIVSPLRMIVTRSQSSKTSSRRCDT